MKRVCVVGYGAIGPVHAKALETTENAVLYGICDCDPGQLAAAAESYDVKLYTSFSEVLQDENIDAVHICTPHHLHFSMIRDALAAGKTVVTEKPVTRTEEEYRQLLALPGADKVCVVLQNRYNTCIQELKALSDSGALGKLQMLKGIVTWCRTPEYYKKDSWRGHWATEGGGVLINQAVHTLDLMCHLAGKVTDVKSTMANLSLRDAIEVEDTVTARLQFEGGIGGIFFATNGYFKNSAPYLELEYEKGLVRYMDGQLWVNGELVAKNSEPVHGKPYWGTGHALLLKNFYDAGVYFSPADVENSMHTMFQIYENSEFCNP